MTNDAPASIGPGRGLGRRLMFAALIICACSVSISWTWSRLVPDIAGLARVRFAEGLAITVAVLLLGAVFETGRRLASGHGEARRRTPGD